MNAAMPQEQQSLTPVDGARRYRRRKLDPIPVPPREKNPNYKNWQNEPKIADKDLERRFPDNSNIGIRTGVLSANHIDIDLDAPEALTVAPYFLPRTGMIHGRQSKDRSHWWYVVAGAKTKKYQFPEEGAGKEQTVYVELRAGGCQTVVPPSLHPSGERIFWISFGEATEVASADMEAAVARTAVATLLARHWPGKGSRHDADLALSGMLAHAGWSADDINEFVRVVAEAAGDEEYRDRGQGESSVRKIADSSPVNGAPKLSELLRNGDKVVSKAREWLGMAPTASAANGSTNKVRDIGDAVWKAPEPLPDGRVDVDVLDPGQLPAAFAPWLTDIQHRLQVPLDFVAVGAICVVGALIGRRIGIHPKQQDDWLVIPNLWGAVVGLPSVMKTPALNEVMKPLDMLVAEAEEAFKSAELVFKAEDAVVRSSKKAIEKEMEKAAAGHDEDTLKKLAEEYKKLGAQEPTRVRYKTNDATIEKIGELLEQNPPGLLLFRDELIGWLRSFDKPGHETDRQFFLEAWSGTQPYTVDRVGTGTRHIQALCISILGGIQPGPLASYVYHATKEDGVGNDGLLQRFNLLVWPDISKEWVNVDQWPNKEARERAYAVFRALAGIAPDAVGATKFHEDDPREVPALRFSQEAQTLFDAWRLPFENRLRSDDEDLGAPLIAHLTKYRSLTPSLALIFHLIDVVDPDRKEDLPTGVNEDAVATAITWVEYLESHAKRVYANATNHSLVSAHALLARIHAGDVSHRMVVRDISQKHWSKLSTADEVNDAIAQLEAYGWVRVLEEKTGGRPSQYLQLHPDLRRFFKTA